MKNLFVNLNEKTFSGFEQGGWIFLFVTILLFSFIIIYKHWSENQNLNQDQNRNQNHPTQSNPTQSNKKLLVTSGFSTLFAFLIFNPRALTFSALILQLYISPTYVMFFVCIFHVLLFFSVVLSIQIYYDQIKQTNST